MTLKKIILPIFLSIGTIFAFIISFNKTDSSNLITNTTYSKLDSASSSQQKIDQTVQNSQNLHKLSVLPLRCIGCGKCARIDSSHFKMDYTTGKAIVISSTNLNSQKLVTVINICPVQAITLN